MNILLTVNTSWNIWNFRRPVVRDLMRAGHRVTVLAPPDDAVAPLRAMGCRVLPLEIDVKGLNPLRDLALMGRFWRQFRRERPDVILSYTIKNNIFGAVAAKWLGIPFVPNVSGLGTAFLSGGALQRLVEAMYRRAFARLPVVFFQNSEDRDLFVTRRLIAPEQARVLPGSGIDLVRFAATPAPDPGRPPRFLLIARLLRDKGVVEYVEAARRVRAVHPDARFHLLGAVDAENRSAIDAATLSAWLAEGVVEHLGTTDDVRPFIAEADCVVLPSYREGAPRTLIEAAAMARPLIATDVPGCRAVVEAGVSGFLCRVRDADSLAEAMLRFLALPPEARAAMGRAARAHMERDYDEAHVVAAYRQAIADVTVRPCTNERRNSIESSARIGAKQRQNLECSGAGTGRFVISLDFELLWGVRDHADRQSYGRNVIGAREAIPRMLDAFAAKDVKATWATVGFLFCESKDELLAALPDERPVYTRPGLSSYAYLQEVGSDERSDPFYFGASLIDQIKQTPGQEIGTHTLSHCYCLEDGMTVSAFEADLAAAIEIAERKAVKLRSIVFPRNQFAPEHLEVCARRGITHFRGNPAAWAFRPAKGAEQTPMRRALRLADAYSGVLGAHGSFPHPGVPLDIPASRFLRPCSGKLAPIHPLHLAVIKRGMTAAAMAGQSYHLWWHPHNFGAGLEANMHGLRQILEHFANLRDQFGMRSAAMEDFE